MTHARTHTKLIMKVTIVGVTIGYYRQKCIESLINSPKTKFHNYVSSIQAMVDEETQSVQTILKEMSSIYGESSPRKGPREVQGGIPK